MKVVETVKIHLIKRFPSLMRLPFLLQKRNVECALEGEQIQEGRMARCYQNPSDEVLETIHSS